MSPWACPAIWHLPCHPVFVPAPWSLVCVLGCWVGAGVLRPRVCCCPSYPEEPDVTDGSPSVLARNALVVSFAALVAYSFEVTGYQPFVLTGQTAEGLPPVRIPSFSVTTANGTVSFTEMVQVRGDGARPAGGAAVPSGPGSVPPMHLLRNEEV